MRSTFRKILACTLLATYAGISMLGEGLHSLTPDGHHHGSHVVTCVAHHEHDGHCCVEHCHDAECEHANHVASSDEKIVTAGGCDSCTHTCEICEFLAQAVSQPPQITATPELHTLVADLPCIALDLYAAATLGPHAARGPPAPAA